MAASRPPFRAAFEHRPVERVGTLAERGGAAVALVAGVLALVTGSVLLVTATPANGVDSLVTAATAPASALGGLALVFHWAVVGVAVGGWFLGLGFIVTGFLE
ncbi:hypothetical protein [Haloarchaeobius sp. DT45]|uniref:hypothetical protein n=1 Tax=Haloarchaeobius sp. DT45 TaxID=3446116 RepID=UPI003F6D7DBF